LRWELDFHGAGLAAVAEELFGEALGDLVVAWLALRAEAPRSARGRQQRRI
jgi:hypothetical protein